MTRADVSVRFSVYRVRFSGELLAEAQWWMLRATDPLDSGDADRGQLVAAALYVQWLRDEVDRLLETAATQRDRIRRLAEDAPTDPPRSVPARVRRVMVPLPKVNDAAGWLITPAPLPNGLQSAHTEFYPVPWLLRKACTLLGWSRGGTLGQQAQDITEGIAALRDWAGELSLFEAVSASFDEAVTLDEIRALGRDEGATHPTIVWLRWIGSVVSEYRMPAVSAAAHARYMSELLTSCTHHLEVAASLCADDDADRPRLEVAADYARWLRDGAIWQEMEAAATCTPPWSSTSTREISPWQEQWLSARPPVPTEPLDRDNHHGLDSLREASNEIMWLRNRSHGYEPVASDPAYFTAWVSTIGSQTRW